MHPMSTSPETQEANRTTSAVVASLAELGVGEMKVAKVGEHRVAVIRTASGVHALDNACPHQGYGLVTGALTGETVVCQWHNWKFDVRTGECIQGEENVTCHPVQLDGDDVVVSVTEPTDHDVRSAVWPSLRSGIEANYIGQFSRDTARLLTAGASPEDIIWEAIRYGAPRAEWGPDHEMAMAADCLAIALERTGDEQALALVQGISGIAEVTRGRTPHTLPEPDVEPEFQQALEDEDIAGLQAKTLALIAEGVVPDLIRHEFILAASRHHLGYGHGIIYVQKAFEILDMVGWDKAADLLPYIASGTAWQTREDLLPYMRTTMRLIEAADLEALAAATAESNVDCTALADALLEAGDAPIEIAIDAVIDGAGMIGLIDALSIAASRRMLRHSLDVEFMNEDDFGWLDITHVLTMVNAVRWAWEVDPGPHVARLGLFATWLLFDSSRAERRHGVATELRATPTAGDLQTAIRFRDTQAALNAARGLKPGEAGDELVRAALADQSGAFIVVCHQIKLSLAAKREAEATGSHLPVLAAARYLSSPRNERFVRRNVTASLDFVATGRPPKR